MQVGKSRGIKFAGAEALLFREDFRWQANSLEPALDRVACCRHNRPVYEAIE